MPRARARVLVPIIVVGLLLVGGAIYVISPVPPPTPYGETTTRGEFLDQFLKQKVKGDDVRDSQRHNSFHDLLIAARWYQGIGRQDPLDEERERFLKGELNEVSQQLRDHVNRNEQPLAIVKKAVRETCTMPTTEGFAYRLSHLVAFRELARGLTTRAKIREFDGDLEGAYEDYLDVLRLGNCPAQGEVTVIYGLLGIAIHSIGAGAMEPGIRNLDEPLLEQVIAGLQEVEGNLVPLKKVLESKLRLDEETIEYVMKARGNLRWLRSQVGDAPEPNAVTNLAWLYALFNRGRIRKNFQKFKATMLEYADRPISESRAPLSQLQEDMQNSDHINRRILPAIVSLNDQWARDRVRLRALLLRAAVELYERRQGKYPETLQQLVEADIISAIPDDPFDGEKFRYIPSADGGKIYSVGPDLVDNKAEIEWYLGKDNYHRDAEGDWVF
jgi:hypothetical protein